MAMDWLFQGSPTPNVTGSSVSESSLPAWYQDYVKSLVMRSSEVAAQPYQTYEGPRIADQTPEQIQARQMAQNVGQSYQPLLNSAATMVENGTQAADPSKYANPFLDQNLDRLTTLGNRNLTENLIPNINSTFTGANQFGSTRNAEFMNRALRDTQEGIAAAQGKTGLDAWSQAGTLSAQDNLRSLQGGQQMGALAQMQQQGDIRSMSALDTVGTTAQNQEQRSLDTAYQDFLAQQQYPRDQAGFMSGIIRGQQMPTTNSAVTTTPSGMYNPSPLAQVGGFASVLGGLGQLFGN